MTEGASVMVVDDEPLQLAGMVRLLENNGYAVTAAKTGRECLAKVNVSRPALILLDVMLPDINGLEVCSRIKSDPDLRETFIVIISGHKISALDRRDGLTVGGDFYLTRPISNQAILFNVASLLQIHENRRFLDNERNSLAKELQQYKREITRMKAAMKKSVGGQE